MKVFLQGEVLTAEDLNANFAEGSVNTAAQYTFTNVISFANTISANGSNGTAGYALLSGGNSANLYWGIAGVNTAAQYTFTNVISFSNAISANGSTGTAGYSLVSNGAGGVYWAYSGAGGIDVNAQYTLANTITHTGPLAISNVITANSSNGTTGQVLSSNGTGVYWQSLTGVNTTAQYTYSNTITFNGPIVSANTFSANGSVGSASYLLTSGGASKNVYWTDISTTYVNTSQLSSNLSNYVNTTQLSSNLSNYALTTSGTTTFTGNVSVTSNLSVSGTTTLYGNVTISGNVTTVNANNLSVVDNMIYLNSTSLTANPDIGIAANYNDGTYHHTGIFRDASDGIWKVFDNYTPEPDASPYIDTTHATFHLADFQSNSITIGNTSVTATINSTAYTGTSYTANNASYFGTQLPAYYTNATNITTGTLPYAQLGSAVVNTSGSFTLAGNTTLGGTNTVINSNTFLTAAVTVNNSLSMVNYNETVYTGGTISVNANNILLANGNIQTFTLANASITLTINTTSLTSGKSYPLTLILTQDGTGGRLVTWGNATQTVKWAGGSAPTLSTSAANTDIITLFTINGGTVWYGAVVGKYF